jgi:hypothetical protein
MAAATTPGRFYQVEQAAELAGVYHDIVLALTGGRTAGPVVQAEVAGAGLRQTLEIEPGLARMTLVISKSQPELAVTILQPDGLPLLEGQPGVRYAGVGVAALGQGANPEIWVVDAPEAGPWTVLADGSGRVTIWQDYQLEPPTATPSPSYTPRPSRTPIPPASPTAEPPSPTPTPTPAQPGPSSTATWTPTAIPLVVTPSKPRAGATAVALPRPPSGWPIFWLSLTIILLGGAGTGGWLWWLGQRPVVGGTIYFLAEPTANPVELDRLKRPRLIIGRVPADIPLAGCTEQVTLWPGEPLGDTHEIWIRGTAGVLLNGEPLSGERRLEDAAVLTVGRQQLQYQNLRLHRASRLQALAGRPVETFR